MGITAPNQLTLFSGLHRRGSSTPTEQAPINDIIRYLRNKQPSKEALVTVLWRTEYSTHFLSIQLAVGSKVENATQAFWGGLLFLNGTTVSHKPQKETNPNMATVLLSKSSSSRQLHTFHEMQIEANATTESGTQPRNFPILKFLNCLRKGKADLSPYLSSTENCPIHLPPNLCRYPNYSFFSPPLPLLLKEPATLPIQPPHQIRYADGK